MSEGATSSEAPALPAGASCAVHPDLSASFVCTRCGTFGCAACAFTTIEKRETCRACADKGLGEPIPWERRKELGWWRAFWKTVSLASLSPTRFFRTPTTDRGIVGAVAHGVLSNTVGLVLTYAVFGLAMMLGGGGVALALEEETAGPLGAVLGAYGCVFLGMSPIGALFAIPSTLFAIVIAAGASHGTLALAKKTKGSFEDTLRAVSYANAPRVWSWIPAVGGPVSYVWGVAAEVIALRETHRCGTDWAVIAAVGYRVVLFVVMIVGYAAIVLGMLFLGRSGGGA